MNEEPTLTQRIVSAECRGCKARAAGRNGSPCDPRKCIPREVRKAFHSAGSASSPHSSLWRDVVGRAVLDACLPRTEGGLLAMTEARRWFLDEPSPDRSEVMALAELDEALIVRAVRLHIAKVT